MGVAGNMLAGEAVVRDTMAAMAGDGAVAGSLQERMMAAMLAGERAGGDRRGRQSAAMLLTTTEDFPDLNLRVDDHRDPLEELRRLLAIWTADVQPGLGARPRRTSPSGVTDLDAIEAPWIERGSELRLRR